MADFPANCSNCGAAIYAQWWSGADAAYKCRVCGTLNPGLRPELAPASRGLVGCLILLWGGIVLWGLFGIQAIGSCLRSIAACEGGETGIAPFLFAVIGVPWLIVLAVTAVATWRLRRRS